jgi:anthranilate phosphoribosyltransferase
VLETLTRQLVDNQSLTDTAIADAVRHLTNQNIPPHIKADFLAALARKGESPAEIAAFVRELRSLSLQPPLDPQTRSRQILDVCGTGGDRLNTFNISTTVAIVVAAAGVTVAKHGNRAITSQAGSADVLEALGVKIDLEPEQAALALREHHFAFFFAPKYHPAFKEIAPARKLCAERGQRTIFNFLGPLLNPVRPALQLVGVPRPELCGPIAQVLQLLGVRRAMVVSGAVPASGAPAHLDTTTIRSSDSLAPPSGERARERGSFPPMDAVPKCDPGPPAHLDELSTLGDNCVAEFYQERGFSISTLSPRDFPLQPARLSDLAGADKTANAQIVRQILRGVERGPKRDAVLLNCAAALFVAEESDSLTEGWQLAEELIDSGGALAKLEQLSRASQ